MELMDLGVGRSTAFNLNVRLLVLHLQLVELLCHLLVLVPQRVQLLLVVADCLEQLRVRGLTREELLHDLLDVGEARLRPDLLEGLLDFGRPRHLFVHLGLKEGAPKLLRQEILVHLQLVRILVVICSLISDLLLASVALDSSFKSGLLVIEGLEHGCQSILPLEVILVNQAHQFFQSVLRLEPLLLRMPMPFGLLLVNSLLVLVTILGLIEPDLNGYQVLIHAVDHVLTLALDHFGLVVLVLDRLQPVQGLV